MNAAINKKTYIHSMICIILMIGIGFLPAFGSVTESGMRVIGVFIGMMYGWIFCGYIWPSFLGILIFGFSGVMGVTQAMAAGFSNQSVVQIIACFVFAGLLDGLDVGEALAGKVLGIEAFRGKPWLIVSIIIISSWLISSVSNTFLVFFLYAAIIVNMAEKCGWKKGGSEVTYLLGGVLFAASCGSILFPFHATAIMFVGFMTSAVGITVGFGEYVVWVGVMQGLSLVLILLVGRFIARLDYSALAEVDFFEDTRGKKLSVKQKVGVTCALAFVLALALPDFMPETWAITILLKQLGLVGVLCIIFVVVAIIQTSEGKPLGDLRDFTIKGINWDVTWLIVATMPVASAISSEELGISKTIVQYLSPILSQMSIYVFILLATVILGLLTQVMHNLVLGAAFIPLGSQLLLANGAGEGLVIIYTLALTVAIMPAIGTPAGAAQSPIFHGHPWVTPKYAYMWGFIMIACGIVAIIIAGIPLGNIVF